MLGSQESNSMTLINGISYLSVNCRLRATLQSDFKVRPELYFLVVNHPPPPLPEVQFQSFHLQQREYFSGE